MVKKKTKKKSYTSGQIFGMIGIIFFIFPVMFNIFSMLSLPVLYAIKTIMNPAIEQMPYFMATAYILKLTFGIVGGVWISRYVWPKRIVIENINNKTIEEKEIDETRDELKLRLLEAERIARKIKRG